MKYKFNEKAAIEQMIKNKHVDENNVTNTIYTLAKYNYHVLGLSDKDNYNAVLEYILDNTEMLFEEAIYKDIDSCIKSAKKHKMAYVEEVCITASELETIKALNDIKKERIMFVILAVAKYNNALHHKGLNGAFLNLTEIFRLSRCTGVAAADRPVFMQFAYDLGLIERHTNPDSILRKLTFIDDEDEVVMRLNQSDYLDLANTYMAYKKPRKYRRCLTCGKWIDRAGLQCGDCVKARGSKKDPFKVVTCKDCGQVMVLKTLNTKTTRCEECQKKHRKEYMKDYMKKARS